MIKPIGRKIGDETINQTLGSEFSGIATSVGFIPALESQVKTVN